MLVVGKEQGAREGECYSISIFLASTCTVCAVGVFICLTYLPLFLVLVSLHLRCSCVCASREPQPMDVLTSNHVLEADKLQNEVSTCSRQCKLCVPHS